MGEHFSESALLGENFFEGCALLEEHGLKGEHRRVLSEEVSIWRRALFWDLSTFKGVSIFW